YEACTEKPDLIIDFATLTGAARVALGPTLPAMFTNDDAVSEALHKAAEAVKDPIWRLPLWQPYMSMLSSTTADYKNGGPAFGGAITAALFMELFIDKGTPWVHFDTYGW